MKANGFDEKTARGAFDMMDKNKNSIIDRKEFIAAEMKFWLDLDNKDTDGIYNFYLIYSSVWLFLYAAICYHVIQFSYIKLNVLSGSLNMTLNITLRQIPHLHELRVKKNVIKS